MLYPHHFRTVECLVTVFKDDPRFLALIVGGSLVKGYGDESSDVDICWSPPPTSTRSGWRATTTGTSTARCATTPMVTSTARSSTCNSCATSPTTAASRRAGPSPTPSSPSRTRQSWKRLVRRIPVYPDAEHERNLAAFFSQAHLMTWFTGEAEMRHNTYLMMTAVSRLVLFSGRLILAHNRIVYPHHKWFLRALADAPDKPDDLLPLIDQLMAEPNHVHARALLACVEQFRDWGARPEQAAGPLHARQRVDLAQRQHPGRGLVARGERVRVSVDDVI